MFALAIFYIFLLLFLGAGMILFGVVSWRWTDGRARFVGLLLGLLLVGAVFTIRIIAGLNDSKMTNSTTGFHVGLASFGIGVFSICLLSGRTRHTFFSLVLGLVIGAGLTFPLLEASHYGEGITQKKEFKTLEKKINSRVGEGKFLAKLSDYELLVPMASPNLWEMSPVINRSMSPSVCPSYRRELPARRTYKIGKTTRLKKFDAAMRSSACLLPISSIKVMSGSWEGNKRFCLNASSSAQDVWCTNPPENSLSFVAGEIDQNYRYRRYTHIALNADEIRRKEFQEADWEKFEEMDVQGPFRIKADENAILGRSGIYRITTSSNIELFCEIISSSEPRNIKCTVDTNFKEGVRLRAEYLRIPFNPNSIETSSLSIYQDAVEFWNAMMR